MANSSVIVYTSHRSWLSDRLMEWGVITSPLEEIVQKVNRLNIHAEVEDNDPSGDEYLKSLDPRRWKEQDHYAILGLKKQRYRASEDEIRRNYRRKILAHHPDKRGTSVDVETDYFACITRAFEILGDPVKRRSYDSVDPTFDDDIPANNAISKADFYQTFAPVFERNSRWSTKQPVPHLGNESSTRESVDEFYSFWYNFDSWREYSYEDEEDKERGQDRDERRWIEKENRAVRLTKKKEEMSRIRQLVDNAYACDPRISKFKEAEKTRREEEKQRKAAARKAAIDEAARIEEEKRQVEAEKQAQLEEQDRQRKDVERKEREAKKKARKKIKKQLENLLEACNYFESINLDDVSNANQASSRGKVQVMIDFEKMCHACNHDEEFMKSFLDELTSAQEMRQKYCIFVNKLASVCNSSSQPGATDSKPSIDQNSNRVPANSTGGGSGTSSSSSKTWSTDDCFLLIKAAKLFPPGTKERYDVITAYLNQHTTSGITRKTRDVMAKSKELQDPKVAATLKSDSLDNQQSKNGLNSLITAEPSERLDVPEVESAWTESEQRLLEQALITFTKDVPKRWDKIAAAVSTRSKESCIKRYKELAAMVQAKKQAIKLAASARK